MQKEQFTSEKQTSLNRTHSGLDVTTKVKLHGKCWVITTMKGHNKVIFTSCRVVEPHGDNYSFVMFGAPQNEDFKIHCAEGKATEKFLTEVHNESLRLFDLKDANGELPKLEDNEVIRVGQVLYTHMSGTQNRRAVYNIEDTGFGTVYFTVSLDGSGLHRDDHIRPSSQTFGIGVYFVPGDVIAESELPTLIEKATEADRLEDIAREKERLDEKAKEKERQKYLSQFTRADQRTTTEIVKKTILAKWPSVTKVSAKYESFSGGDSFDVTYHAPEPVEEIEDFVRSFKYGHWDGMNDIYEYGADKDIVIDGFILRQYKYCNAHYEKSEPRPEPSYATTSNIPANAIPGSLEVVSYSERSIALFGDTKPLKDALMKLGGRFNFYLQRDGVKTPGWIFPATKKDELELYLSLLNNTNS